MLEIVTIVAAGLGLVALLMAWALRDKLNASEARVKELEERWGQVELLSGKVAAIGDQVQRIHVPDLQPLQEEMTAQSAKIQAVEEGIRRDLQQEWQDHVRQLTQRVTVTEGDIQATQKRVEVLSKPKPAPPGPSRPLMVRRAVVQYLLDHGFEGPQILASDRDCEANPAVVRIEAQRAGVRIAGEVTVSDEVVTDARLQSGYNLFP